METEYAVRIPWLAGIIATRSFTEELEGIKELVIRNEQHIRDGMVAYGLLEELKAGNDTPENREAFLAIREHLGYGLLLKRYTDNGRRCHR